MTSPGYVWLHWNAGVYIENPLIKLNRITDIHFNGPHNEHNCVKLNVMVFIMTMVVLIVMTQIMLVIKMILLLLIIV